MPYIEDFLTAQEEQEIIEAIRLAESETSGEIRVHIVDRNSNLRAQGTFQCKISLREIPLDLLL